MRGETMLIFAPPWQRVFPPAPHGSDVAHINININININIAITRPAARLVDGGMGSGVLVHLNVQHDESARYTVNCCSAGRATWYSCTVVVRISLCVFIYSSRTQ